MSATVGRGVALLAPEQAVKRIKKLEAEMTKLARNLEFEQAARVRDEIQKLSHRRSACRHSGGVGGRMAQENSQFKSRISTRPTGCRFSRA